MARQHKVNRAQQERIEHSKKYYVTDDKWRDAIKFLLGLGTNPDLTKDEQRKLSAVFRGPFKHGLHTTTQAIAILLEMGWERKWGIPSATH